MSVGPQPRATLVSVFGKTPARGDFIRPRIASGEMSHFGFEGWLHEAADALRAVNGHLEKHPLCFALFAANGKAILTGVMIGSHDRVGREFPFGVCCLWPSEFGLHPCALPIAAGPFFQAAADWLPTGVMMQAEEEMSLPLPDPRTAHFANGAAGQALSQASCSDFFSRCFSQPVESHAHYSVFTLLRALQVTRTSSQAMVVECPRTPPPPAQQADVDLLAWLALASETGRVHAGAQLAACCWQSYSEKLLLSFGQPSKHLLRYWVGCGEASARLWPLHSTRPDAVAHALRGSPLPSNWFAVDSAYSVGRFMDELVSALPTLIR